MASFGTIQSAFNAYVAERRKTKVWTAYSYRTARSILSRFVTFVGPDRRPESITKRDADKWWTDTSSKVSKSTAKNQLSTVRAFMRWMVERDVLRLDPTRHIRPGKSPRRIPRTLSPDEMTRLLTCCDDDRSRALVLLAVHCGLRCGELARMDLDHIDFRERTVTIDGKGGHERLVPIPAEAWAALMAYIGQRPRGTGPVFLRLDTEQRISDNHMSKLLRNPMHQSGIKTRPHDGVSGHALRRTCATDLFDRGANIRQVQAMLGHQSMATTERHYVRWATTNELRQVAEGRTYLPAS